MSDEVFKLKKYCTTITKGFYHLHLSDFCDAFIMSSLDRRR
jgi:hypothetical protein